ncbi:MAG: hypothetical protein HYT79_01390 [Elusimicrobia bacterium]|nr:hypothetical protein [Elusimicrobiota bacterium]
MKFSTRFLLLGVLGFAVACSKGSRDTATSETAQETPVREYKSEGTAQSPVLLKNETRHDGAAPKGGTSYYAYTVEKGPNVKLNIFYVGNLDIFQYPDAKFENYDWQWGGATSMYTEYGEDAHTWENVKPGQAIYFTVVNNAEEPERDDRPTAEYGLLFQEF